MSLLLLPRPRSLERRQGDGAPKDATPDVAPDPSLPAEGYVLEIDATGVSIRHADAAGRRYAEATLGQLRQQAAGRLPALRIEDSPDFPVRGMMLDVSRDRVPTRACLERLVGHLATFRLNHLELYVEHTFAYADHEAVWRDASPLSPDDIRWLDRLCQEHGIELCANQNTFGHMGRWLAQDAYRDRAEAPDGFETKFGVTLAPGVLEPTEDNADFALGLCREMLTAFRSRRINIGCDETFELGKGKSRARVEAEGKGRVYLDHVRRLIDGLQRDGQEVLFWGDILRSHPELVGELPADDLIALAWHYEAPVADPKLPEGLREIVADFGITEELMKGFGGHVEAFADAGRPFWVCPGTSSWNTLIGRFPNARENLLDAARVGAARGATGYLITDWGDNGHMQPPSVSDAPLAYGGAVAWCAEANHDLDLAPLLDAFVYADAAGELGATLLRLGGLYEQTGKTALNGSPLFTDLVEGGLLGSMGEAQADGVAHVVAELDACRAAIAAAKPGCADGPTVQRELRQAARLARHGAWRIGRAAGFDVPDDAALATDLDEAIAEQVECWLLRSRPGGLADSIARLEATRARYG